MKWRDYAFEIGCLLLSLLFLLVMIAVVSGCALPVRPIAKIETGADGKQHFVPDREQEPQVGGFLQGLLPLLGAVTGAGGLTSALVIFLKSGRIKRALESAVAFGNDMAKANCDLDAEEVKARHAIIQADQGTKGLIDGALSKLSKLSKLKPDGV